jgi:histone H3/H4
MNDLDHSMDVVEIESESEIHTDASNASNASDASNASNASDVAPDDKDSTDEEETTVETSDSSESVEVEVRKYQRTTDFLIHRKSFKLLVKEILHEFKTDVDMTVDAVDALQTAAEEFLVQLFATNN